MYEKNVKKTATKKPSQLFTKASENMEAFR
jgi:hypothetical protein